MKTGKKNQKNEPVRKSRHVESKQSKQTHVAGKGYGKKGKRHEEEEDIEIEESEYKDENPDEQGLRAV